MQFHKGSSGEALCKIVHVFRFGRARRVLQFWLRLASLICGPRLRSDQLYYHGSNSLCDATISSGSLVVELVEFVETGLGGGENSHQHRTGGGRDLVAVRFGHLLDQAMRT